MNIATLPSKVDSDSLFQGLVEQLQFVHGAENWSQCVSALTRWEDEHLLEPDPSVEALARHKKILERLIFFGQLCALVCSHPDFNDDETTEMVEATQAVLRQKLRMWHGPRVSREKSDSILEEVFPES